MNKGPEVSPVVATAILCLLVGGAVGYYARYFSSPDTTAARAPAASGAMAGGGMRGPGGPGGMGGRGGGGYGGGGMGGAPSPGMTLARLVRNLDTVQMVQGKGLTPEQAKTLVPVLQQLKSAETLADADAEKQTAAIQKVLTPEQQAALDSLQPQFGGRGGRGGGGGGYGGGGMGGPGGPGGGMAGGGRPDPQKPFANERNQKALDDLLTKLSKA